MSNIFFFEINEDEQIEKSLWYPLVKLRANYTCERCGNSALTLEERRNENGDGRKGDQLHSHHKDQNKENNCLANGECLCRSCHSKETIRANEETLLPFRKSIGDRVRGIPKSPEQRKKMSEAQKGRKKTEEQKEIMRKAQQERRAREKLAN